MSLFIGVETVKSEYIFAVTLDMTLIGKTAHMYANMQQRGGMQSSKSRWRWKGEQMMILSDGYSLTYYPKRNTIEIVMPQTITTLTNTVTMISNRKTTLTETEEQLILLFVRAIVERRSDENIDDAVADLPIEAYTNKNWRADDDEK